MSRPNPRDDRDVELVTGACSTPHVELVRSLGADEVIDRLQQDFTTNGQTYDAIIDAVGKHTFRRSRRSLEPGGVFVATDGLENLLVWAAMRLVGRKRLRFASGRRSREDVLLLKQLIEAGEYRAVVDRVYPMDQAIEAHHYVETWHKAGNVVLTIPSARSCRPATLRTAASGRASARRDARQHHRYRCGKPEGASGITDASATNKPFTS